MCDYDSETKQLLTRLHRINGQVHAVEKMVENNAECTDILMQLSAATAALRSVAIMISQQEISHCVERVAQCNTDKNSLEETQKIMTVLQRLLKYEKS